MFFFNNDNNDNACLLFEKM